MSVTTAEVLLQAERALREGLPMPPGCEHLIARAVREYVAAGCRPSDKYTFVRAGEGWFLDDGRDHHRFWRSRVGFERLHTLLCHRGRELHVLTLGPVDVCEPEDVGEHGLGILHDEVADSRALREIAARLEEIEGNEELAEEKEQLRDYLRSAQGQRRLRPFVDEAERARQSVAKSIKRAIEEITEVTPEMGLHLRLSVRTGEYVSYQPDSRVLWNL